MGRFAPAYLLAALVLGLGSVCSGVLAGQYAIGDPMLRPGYRAMPTVVLTAPPTTPRWAGKRALASLDLDDQWPVGGLDEDGGGFARP